MELSPHRGEDRGMTGGQLLSGERPTDAPELQRCLREVLGSQSVRLVDRERLKADVHRLRVAGDGDERSVVVKWSDSVVARRCRLVAWRWLPAAGLEDLGAPLLAVAADPNGEGAWHIYEDLPGRPLSTDRPVESEVEAAIAAIARVHTAFAEHPLLREARLWGGDRGIHFFSSNIRDAVIALHSLDASAARDALLQRMSRLENEGSERAQVLAAVGGPETLVHGDLWPSNVIVPADEDSPAVHLIDWDEAGVGPIGFDVSTFLLRFDPSHRRWILDAYRRAVGRLAGWDLPDERELNLIFSTAAYARLASLLVWSVAAPEDGEPDWLAERLADLVEWIDEVEPVLPAR
jgi:Ser/Thr protein kinase RdoA (MazF antagonist)